MCNRFTGGGGVCEKRSTLRMLSYVLLAVLLAIPFSLHAQQYSGTITGTVTDPSGAVITKARITVRNEATNAVRNAETNDDGDFTVALLPPGPVQRHGFRAHRGPRAAATGSPRAPRGRPHAP